MASAVDLCNIGLSHLGNARRVAAIDPPDGTAEADFCATFYPIARDELLESADWSFARTRAALALLTTNDSETWAYAYAKPSDCIMPRRIITGDATAYEQDSENFDCEGDVIYSNKEDAVLLYTRLITDTTKYSPSFQVSFGYLLASYLAGPIIKGDEGAKAGQAFRKASGVGAPGSVAKDANKTSVNSQAIPSALLARNGTYGSTTPSADAYAYGSGYALN